MKKSKLKTVCNCIDCKPEKFSKEIHQRNIEKESERNKNRSKEDIAQLYYTGW